MGCATQRNVLPPSCETYTSLPSARSPDVNEPERLLATQIAPSGATAIPGSASFCACSPAAGGSARVAVKGAEEEASADCATSARRAAAPSPERGGGKPPAASSGP